MTRTFINGAGDKVKLFVSLLPLGSRVEPVDQTITAAGGITSAATSITVTALTSPIAGGTPLIFDNGTDTLRVYLSSDADIGDTTLTVEETTGSLTGSSTAGYVAKLRYLGGTQLNANIASNRSNVLVFEDPLGYEDGVITSQSWELPWTGNYVPDDPAYESVYFAGINAISGREVYVWQEDPPPSGYTKGAGLQGAAVVMNPQKPFTSTAICTFTCTFMGQGSPTATRYS